MSLIRYIRESLITPSAAVLAQRELDAAQRELLDAQRNQEFHAAIVTYNRARIARLMKTLQEVAQ
jgi:hypothetical protein